MKPTDRVRALRGHREPWAARAREPRASLLFILLPLACLASACDPSSSEDAGPAETDAGADGGGVVTVDGGADGGGVPTVDADAGDAGHDAGPVEETTIAFTAPDASVLYVRGSVRLELVTTGPAPDRVELFEDDAFVVALSPPYAYDWLSDTDAEGEHVFEARASIDGEVVATAERRFEVDRTPPELIGATPLAGTEAALFAPIVLTFSEPLAAATIDDDSVSVAVETAGLAHTRTLSADATTVELRLTAEPEELPATAVVTLTTAITDRAGNPLEAPATHSLVYPEWLTLAGEAELPTDHQAKEIEVDSTGVVWVLTTLQTSPTVHTLLRWEAGVLDAPVTVAAGAPSLGTQLRMSSTDRPVVVWADETNAIHVETLEADGSWSAHPVLAAGMNNAFDAELGPDDSPFLVRSVTTRVTFEVVRLASGVWSRIGDPVPQSNLRFDLALAGSTPYVAHDADDHPHLSRHDSTWTSTPCSSLYTDCVDTNLVALRDGSVLGVAQRLARIGFNPPYLLASHFLRPPDWAEAATIEELTTLHTDTATGYAYLVDRDGPDTVALDTGDEWPTPTAEEPDDIEFFEGRPYVADSVAAHMYNSL